MHGSRLQRERQLWIHGEGSRNPVQRPQAVRWQGSVFVSAGCPLVLGGDSEDLLQLRGVGQRDAVRWGHACLSARDLCAVHVGLSLPCSGRVYDGGLFEQSLLRDAFPLWHVVSRGDL